LAEFWLWQMNWVCLMLGGAGAVWFGLSGIIEMFALAAEAGS
jgi:hypothetical protein